MTITEKEIKINNIPAIILGNPSRNVYLYIHGQGGNKEEAYNIAEFVCGHGYQILSIDLPEHGNRKGEVNSFDPWHIVPELTEVMKFAKEHWERISLFANSIGAYDVMPLIKVSKKYDMKFNMLLDFCIGKAAASVKEFYLLPVGNKLIQYDKLAVNTIVANKDGEVSSCDIAYTDNLEKFNADYLRYTTEVQGTCIDHDLSEEYMVIGTSAIVNVELDGAIGMNSGIFNNPFT